MLEHVVLSLVNLLLVSNPNADPMFLYHSNTNITIESVKAAQ